jgi:hypothetical protein
LFQGTASPIKENASLKLAFGLGGAFCVTGKIPPPVKTSKKRVAHSSLFLA